MRFHMLVAFLAFASAVLAADLQSQVHGASECGELEQVHGASTVNNWMLITTPLLPANYTPTQICTEGLNCKRLLRPLMTSDDRYQLACPNDCSGNGVCCGGVCACNAGYRGLDCSVERCPGKCSGKGECKLGKCFCEPGFSGDNCEKSLSCPQFAGKECAGHGTCHRGKCFCDPGFTNEKCSQVSKCPNDCHNRGFCLHGMCFCPPGYGGRDCGTELAAATCLNDCSGKGECVRGKCQCYAGHYGSDCSKIVRCPKGANGRICSGLGSCHNGKCECDEGRHGFACSLVQDCPGNGTCSGRGLCLRGTCYCYPGSEGSACERNSPCASGCNGNGVCVEGKCHCLPGYFGADCAKATPWAEYYRLKKCPRFTVPVPVPASIDANGTIKLLVNVSETVPTPNTTACELDQDTIRSMIKLGSPCPNACSGTGVCLNGTCACLPGHAGIDCSEVAEPLKCPNSCSYRGVCVFGRCSCMPPYKGADCSETDDPEAQKALQSRTCPKNCRGRGKCVRGRCICDPGYAGHDCALDIPCKDNCNGRGRCDRGRCFCFPGFEGASCGKVSRCPGGCSAHGQCFYGKCFCDPYYAGEDCSATPTCTKGCHAEHGICRGEDLCVCEPGWTGVSCSEKLQCPKDCSGFDHGVCTATEKGVKCICKPGWIGEDCAKAWDDCPNKCSGKGKCDMGQCRCDPGFTGLDCSAAAGGSALAALTANLASQQTRSNSSAAQPRFRAVTSAELLSRTQSGQEMAARAEASSTTSLASSMRLRSMSMVTAGACPNGCSGKGVCREGVCFCDPGQTGPDCAQVIECPDNCSGNGICQYGRCYCDPNHAGTNCSLKSNTRRTFPQPWVTAILCCVFFFIGMIVGRKSLKYSIEQELKLTDELPSSGTIAQVRA